MYSHVACDVMKERTRYLLKPSSLIWHLMPYLFLLNKYISTVSQPILIKFSGRGKAEGFWAVWIGTVAVIATYNSHRL